MACLKFGGVGFDVDFLEQRGIDFARRLNEGIGSWMLGQEFLPSKLRGT